MRRILLLCLIVCYSFPGTALDYLRYQRIVNRVDSALYIGDLSLALKGMDTVYDDYDFIYARHCIKGLQLALRLKDDTRGERWLMRALMQGVPVWMLRQNGITAELWQRSYGPRVIAAKDSFYAIYRSRIDTVLRNRISHMMQLDARRTRRVNNGFLPLRYSLYALSWWRHNKIQAQEIAAITQKYGFPEEKLIGLPLALEDSATLSPYMKTEGINIVLQNREAFFMLLHYFSTKRSDMNELLLKQIATGNLPPAQYARLNDYLHANTNEQKYPPYHVHDPKHSDDPKAVDEFRARLGLNAAAFQAAQSDKHRALRRQGKLESEIVFDTGA